MSAQQDLLLLRDLDLRKKAVSNGDTATSILQPDSIVWAKEFQILGDFDINKPALIGQYAEEVVADTRSNLMIKRYTAIDPDLEVRNFEVYYLNELDNLKIIRSSSRVTNSIFSSEKSIVLEFDKLQDSIQLTNYRIGGYQKMILQDSVVFEVSGKVVN